jgi:fibro-slime domain-containing protein
MHRAAVAALALSSVACSIETRQGEVGIYQAPSAGSGGAGLPDPGPDTPSFFLTMYLRDFKNYDANDPTTNPDFDNLNSEKSVVQPTLGADRKPIYQAPHNTLPTFGKEYFDQWYRDVPGTNYTVIYPLPMSLGAGNLYEYDSQLSGRPDTYQGVRRRVFFPLDDGDAYATPFGNQGRNHNYRFTGELHARFTASSGRTLHVRSDDDLYVFIDDKLAIDLGGTHVAIAADLNLDHLTLSVGQEYPLDLFYAERLGASAALTLQTNFVLTPVVE